MKQTKKSKTTNEDLLQAINGVKKDVSGLKSDMTGVKKDVGGLKSLKKDVKDLTFKVDDTRQEVKGIRTDLRELKEDTGEIFNAVDVFATDTEQRLSSLERGQKEIKLKLNRPFIPTYSTTN